MLGIELKVISETLVPPTVVVAIDSKDVPVVVLADAKIPRDIGVTLRYLLSLPTYR